LICGIVSVVFIFLAAIPVLGILGIAAGIAAIITGAMAMKKIKEVPKGTLGGNGMAITGLILGISGLVFCLIFLIACAACFSAIGSASGLFDL